ncbi:MAG TPA: hypothetical protein VKA00_03305 [Trueperaceae bacterium]|nr:hypothetical protein [Trueperaceae bacterium]
MQIQPYLSFNGTCRKAFAFYAELLGGGVEMPLAETFWATRFGMVVDRFGTPWMINCNRPA